MKMPLNSKKSRLWKYLLPVTALVLVVVAAVVPRPAPPPSYLRYTSPAFPDGVRYTFLYPSTLDDVHSRSESTQSTGKYIQLVVVSKKESRLPGAALWDRWFRPEAEVIILIVEKATVKPLRSSRSEKQSAYHDEIEHIVLVDDLNTHEHFEFKHAADFGTASFTQHDQVVTDSFRVLLPGEPVPAP